MKPKYRFISVLLGALVFCGSFNAYAEDENADTEEVVLHAQNAEDAVKSLARLYGRPVLFQADDLSSITTNPLNDDVTLQEALDVMFKGTPLEGSLTENGVITVSHRVEKPNQGGKNPMKKRSLFASTALAALGAFVSPATAQDADTDDAVRTEDTIVVLGSRSTEPRSALESPVPIDVIDDEQLNAVGGTVDITDTLRTFIPSYTATPLTGDASAFVRPTSLRGLAGDQTLVLVNGKRRHRSSVIQFNGAAANNGSHGVDVAMIPTIALKNVQVLRDGAAAQYGSDAIAGVINFQLKDADDGGLAVAQYGQHYEGETNYRFAANYGFGIGERGFVNISGEYIDNEALSRGIQRADAQALIDAGVQGVGEDSPFDDAPFVQTWGRPESRGARFFVNSEFDLTDTTTLYAFGNYADTFSRTRFFYRNPNTNGDVARFLTNNPQFTTFPLEQGFTPFFDGSQKDMSLVTGVKGEWDGDATYDISLGYGSNEIDYFLNNTIFFGPVAATSFTEVQRDFDVGGYTQEEINVNADFTRPLTDDISLAYGLEFREESFSLDAGEPNAVIGAGRTSGFRSNTARDARTIDRRNFAAYVDVEHQISDNIFLQYAGRYEDFSDFGDTLNGKVATRIDLADGFSLRAAASTGFHAPTPGQANVTAINTTILTNSTGDTVLVEEGLVRPDSPEALSVGGGPLQEETSVSLSAGFVADTDFGTLTVDAFRIDVDDRIYRTENQPTPSGLNIGFFTNGLDIRSSGVDVVYTNTFDFADNFATDFTFAYNYGKLEVTGTSPTSPIREADIEDIENNFPNHRFVATANTRIGENLGLLLRANYYGEHFDERGRIGVPGGSFEIPGLTSVDVEVSYDFTDTTTLAVGGSNVFDEFPPEITSASGFANRESVGLQYPRRTPFGYDGGSWYVRLNQAF